MKIRLLALASLTLLLFVGCASPDARSGFARGGGSDEGFGGSWQGAGPEQARSNLPDYSQIISDPGPF